ncbi:DUF1826 domain-containing protein [Larsenimonas rhizosphaerae]|uniref:DUF1826 domain-containing protein n=1 Tax=Larsenimonas rhizosphaerae TaxID=2944682 RepID=UPI0020333A41|nr:DUF1826 domain-containing protein [Larsenimonas rhizosphaerae]MCM2129420.1 DUF1826 domain-containing protein [Larsenimonas rhizosphaerae]
MTAALATPLAEHTHWAIDREVSVLPRIFDPEITLAVMQRTLSPEVVEGARAQREARFPLSFSWRGNPEGEALGDDLRKALHAPEASAALIEDVVTLAQAMAYLFETEEVGVRLRRLDEAMCPRFHCDRLPVRLVSTYLGPGSEWLPDDAVNRAGLGAPSASKPDILRVPEALDTLSAGDVALMKGTGWVGSEDRALVHRSPGVSPGEMRLVLTIDPV